MGLPMSGNLVKRGFDVKAFDLNPKTLEMCAEFGVKASKSVAETASDVDYIITSVPATKDVEDLLKGKDGIFKNAKKGTYIVDTSTISPVGAK